MCRDTKALNYQYDDLVPSENCYDEDGSLNKSRFHQEVRKHIDTLYPSTSSVVREAGVYHINSDKFDDYIINVVYDRYALKGRAYSINFFLEDESDPSIRDSLGSVYTFSAPFQNADGTPNCANCATQATEGIFSKAQIPITVPLVRLMTNPTWEVGANPGLAPIPVADMSKDTISRLLKVRFKFEFVEIGGRVCNEREFPHTQIAVLHGHGFHPSYAANRGSHAPHFVEYEKVSSATEDNVLGFGYGGRSAHGILDDSDVPSS